jgi:hypothetical protein
MRVAKRLIVQVMILQIEEQKILANLRCEWKVLQIR